MLLAPANLILSGSADRPCKVLRTRVICEIMVRIADYVDSISAAEMIGCTPGRVHQMVRAGDFRDTFPIGHRKLILRKEVERVARNPAKTGRPRKFPRP